MWPFNRRARRADETRASLAEPDDLLRQLFGVLAAPGDVSGAAALKIPAARAAIFSIAEVAATLPVKLFARTSDSRKVAEEHPVHSVIHGDWSPWQSSFEARLQMTMCALLHGTAFARVLRVRGQVREVHPLDHGAVSCERDSTTGEPRYRLRKSTGDEVLSFKDVLELRAPGGRSPVADAAGAIGLAATLERHSSRLFYRGARPGGILRTDLKLGDDSKRRLQKSWQESNIESGGVPILEEGFKFEPVTLSAVDSQMIEARKFQIAEIGRAFRIPPIFLGDLERATHHNAAEMADSFLRFTLNPWLESWISAIHRSLLTTKERQEYFAEFITDDLLRMDVVKRFTAYKMAVGPNGSWLAPNELRRWDNLPPIEGGDVLAPAAPAAQGSADEA